MSLSEHPDVGKIGLQFVFVSWDDLGGGLPLLSRFILQLIQRHYWAYFFNEMRYAELITL